MAARSTTRSKSTTSGRQSVRKAHPPLVLQPTGRKRGEGPGNLEGRSAHFLKRRGSSTA